MSDIASIKVNGTSYSVMDETARDAAEAAETAAAAAESTASAASTAASAASTAAATAQSTAEDAATAAAAAQETADDAATAAATAQATADSKIDAPTGEISMYFATCAGQVTGSSKRVYFFVPIQGVASGATITFGGVWNIRGVSGNILTNGSLDSLGTVSYVIRTLGIDVRISLSSALSVTNNTPCVVQGGTGATMTIS